MRALGISRLASSGAALVLLAACQTATGPAPDKVTTQPVDLQVAEPCSAAAAVQKPAFADTAEAIAAVPAGGILAIAQLYAAGRQQRIAYTAELEAAVSGCAAPVDKALNGAN